MRTPWADYIRCLTQSLATADRAEDRSKYMGQLAAAARFFAAIRGNDVTGSSDFWVSTDASRQQPAAKVSCASRDRSPPR